MLTDDLEAHAYELGLLRVKVPQLEQEIDRLTMTLEDLVYSKELNRDIEAEQAFVKGLESQISALSASNEEYLARIHQLEADLHEKSAELEALKAPPKVETTDDAEEGEEGESVEKSNEKGVQTQIGYEFFEQLEERSRSSKLSYDMDGNQIKTQRASGHKNQNRLQKTISMMRGSENDSIISKPQVSGRLNQDSSTAMGTAHPAHGQSLAVEIDGALPHNTSIEMDGVEHNNSPGLRSTRMQVTEPIQEEEYDENLDQIGMGQVSHDRMRRDGRNMHSGKIPSPHQSRGSKHHSGHLQQSSGHHQQHSSSKLSKNMSKQQLSNMSGAHPQMRMNNQSPRQSPGMQSNNMSPTGMSQHKGSQRSGSNLQHHSRSNLQQQSHQSHYRYEEGGG